MNKSLVQLVIAGALLLGSVAVFVFWYMAVTHTRAEVVRVEEEIAAKRIEAERIQEARGALSALEDSEARVRSYFIKTEDIGAFLERVTQTGDALGAEVEIVSVTEEAAEARNRIMLAISLTGSFDAIMRTLGALEYGPFDVAIKNVSLNAETEGEAIVGWAAVATFTFGAQ